MKRVFDLCVVILSSPLVLLVVLVVALLVKNKIGSPVLFRQFRPGLNEKRFEMIKFRTMTDVYDESGELLSDDVRLTKFGKFLRSTSLDELPALWHVLKGDMSLIGPRPLLVEYLPLYNDFQKRRHDVKPGITGWAQVNGRNTISWQEKFEYDIWYIENLSFYLDIKIFLMTIIKIFKRENINSDASVTMDKFTGSMR